MAIVLFQLTCLSFIRMGVNWVVMRKSPRNVFGNIFMTSWAATQPTQALPRVHADIMKSKLSAEL